MDNISGLRKNYEQMNQNAIFEGRYHGEKVFLCPNAAFFHVHVITIRIRWQNTDRKSQL